MADTSVATAVRERMRLHRELPPPAARRALRLAAGLTIAEVAQAAGASRQAVSMWERGERTPRGDFLVRYIEALRAMREAPA